MMPRIARAYRTRILAYPAVTEAVRVRVCNREARRRSRAERPASRSSAAPTRNPEESEWATGRFLRARLAGTGALSAGFGTAERRDRIATTDTQASDRPGAAEAVRAGEARRAGAVEAVQAAAAVVAVAAGIAKSERTST